MMKCGVFNTQNSARCTSPEIFENTKLSEKFYDIFANNIFANDVVGNDIRETIFLVMVFW